MDHLIESLEQLAKKMGGVHTCAVVEHGLTVRRRDGQGCAERKQHPEPHLALQMRVCLPRSSPSHVILRGCRALSRSHMRPPLDLSARLNANAKTEKGSGEREEERVLPPEGGCERAPPGCASMGV